MSGFYLMHRGWMDSPLFKKQPFCERLAWEWLIHEASFEPHKIRYKSKMVEVRRGQIPTSYRILKDKFDWGNERVKRFLILLENEQMIATETGTGFLVITICNYDKYQVTLRNSGTQSGTQAGTDPGTQAGTNIKKGKELKEKKEALCAAPQNASDHVRMSHAEIPLEWLAWTMVEKGWTEPIATDVWSIFRDYWQTGKGRNTKRADWLPSWKTWCRKENLQAGKGSGSGQQNKADRAKAAAWSGLKRYRQEQGLE